MTTLLLTIGEGYICAACTAVFYFSPLPENYSHCLSTTGCLHTQNNVRFIRILPSIFIVKVIINCYVKTRLHGVALDHDLNWVSDLICIIRCFLNKQKSRFLPRCVCESLYHKAILPSILYTMSFRQNRQSFSTRLMHYTAALLELYAA